MNIINQTLNIIKTHNLIEPNESIIIGLSGGPDSTALLNILYEIATKKYSFKLIGAHFNHNLRGEESEKDQEFVVNLCNTLNIPIYLTKKENWNNNKLSLEEHYRFARYEWFNNLCKTLNVKKIALGHTADDNLETIVMRLIKGSAAGLKGIKIKNNIGDITLIRPLLYFSKEKILEYLNFKNIAYKIDSSNYEFKYERNRVRHNIIPLLKSENNSILYNSLKTSFILTDEDDYLNKQTEQIFDLIKIKENNQEIILNRELFLKQHICIQRRLIRKVWELLSNSHYTLYFNHVENVINIIYSNEGSKIFNLPANVYFLKEQNKLIFTLESIKKINEFEYKFKLDKTYIEELDLEITINKVINENIDFKTLDNFTAYFDLELLPDKLCWRNYKDNDYIVPIGLNKPIKLNNFFSKNKIPYYKRSHYLLLANGNNILWIVGLRRSNCATVNKNSKNLIKIKVNTI